MKTPFLIGRLIFGGFFLYNGINHLKNRKAMAQYTAAKNVPQPDAAVVATGILLMLGGSSLVLGLKPKLGALALLGFLAGVSPTMHNFWEQHDPQRRQNEMTHFMKNLALAGGALSLMAIEEPWPASVSSTTKRTLPARLKRIWHDTAAA